MNSIAIPVILTAVLVAAVYERRKSWDVIPLFVAAAFLIPTIWAVYFAVLYFNK
jgi:hypothetical protein